MKNKPSERRKKVKDILLQVADGALSLEGVSANMETLDLIDIENPKGGIYKQIEDFISQELQDLLEWVNKELIGEIEYPFGYNGRGLENVIRNGLRRKQRKLLKEKKKEIK